MELGYRDIGDKTVGVRVRVSKNRSRTKGRNGYYGSSRWPDSTVGPGRSHSRTRDTSPLREGWDRWVGLHPGMDRDRSVPWSSLRPRWTEDPGRSVSPVTSGLCRGTLSDRGSGGLGWGRDVSSDRTLQ